MKVKDLMVTELAFCGPETNLAAASELFWKNDCGILPVVEAEKVVGVMTDRDACIALGTRDRRASELTASSGMSRQIFACAPEDDLKSALTTMATNRVRRLPAIGQDGELVGILSLDDVVTRAGLGASGLSLGDVVSVYKALCERRLAVRGTAG